MAVPDAIKKENLFETPNNLPNTSTAPNENKTNIDIQKK